MPNKPVIHVAMRFTDSFGSGDTETIAEHRKVIQSEKAVWMAKFGQPLGAARIAQMMNQCERAVPTYLYLVKRSRSQYNVYRGVVAVITREKPENEDHLIPEYYSELGLAKEAGFWVKLQSLEEVNASILDRLRLEKGGALRAALASSMGNLFILSDAPDRKEGGSMTSS